MIGRMRFVLVLVAVACVLVSCGDDGGGEGDSPRRAEAVIREWADTLREGDVSGAAALFELPSVVSNGTPPLTLHTRAEVRLFNASLPCGAKLLRTSSSGRFTTAVFRLTERPGPGRCGGGTGATARTTFVVRAGKIREWRRVADRPQPGGPVV